MRAHVTVVLLRNSLYTPGCSVSIEFIFLIPFLGHHYPSWAFSGLRGIPLPALSVVFLPLFFSTQKLEFSVTRILIYMLGLASCL